MSSLRSFMRVNAADFRNTLRYKAFIESLRTTLLNDPAGELITITQEEAYLYRGDLTGLLLNKGIPVHEHYVIMRVNNLTSIHSVDKYLTVLFKPSGGLVGQIESLYKQSLGK